MAKKLTKKEIAKKLDANHKYFNFSAEKGSTSYKNYPLLELKKIAKRFKVKL